MMSGARLLFRFSNILSVTRNMNRYSYSSLTFDLLQRHFQYDIIHKLL